MYTVLEETCVAGARNVVVLKTTLDVMPKADPQFTLVGAIAPGISSTIRVNSDPCAALRGPETIM